MSFLFRGTDTFESIPGLMMNLDSQKMDITWVPAAPDRIYSITENSPNSFRFNSLSSWARMTDDGWFDMKFYDANFTYDLTQQPKTTFAFLHDGSPYLIYVIGRIIALPGMSGFRFPVNTTAQSNALGIETLCTVDPTIAGRFTYHNRVHFDGTFANRPMNMSLITNNMKITTGLPFLASHKCYGFGSVYGINEVNIYFDRVRIGGANYNRAELGPSHRTFSIGVSGGDLVSMRLLLTYNMTGRSGAEIDSFDERIKDLIFKQYGV